MVGALIVHRHRVKNDLKFTRIRTDIDLKSQSLPGFEMVVTSWFSGVLGKRL